MPGGTRRPATRSCRAARSARPSAPLGSLEQLLSGPSDDPDGDLNLFGGLRRAMAKCGYRDLKEFQKVGLVLDR